jgi:molybdopterin-guanine dinucleotide biosynthesis protein A
VRHASEPDRAQFAIVLAGGSGRRLGTVDKPALTAGGRTLLDIALAAVAPALTVVVGPPRKLAASIMQTREEPPGGGPCAAIAAGVRLLADRLGPDSPPDALVAIFAADLPGVEVDVVASLCAAVRGHGADGAVLTDPDGRDQFLAGVWRFRALRRAIDQRTSWDGGRVSELLEPLIGVRIPADARQSSDADTPEDLRRWGIERPGDVAGE